MSEPTLSDNMDSNALLTALISGGIISGSVGILEGTFEKTKYIFPTAIALGIWADYLIQRQRNRENIELVQDYVFEIEDLTRKAILKMIFFSQENGYEDLEPKDLAKKIGEAVFDDSLKEKFAQIGKEILIN